MARIRSIKPEFWGSESITNLSREARLVYIGLWCFADDEGRFRAQLGVLAGQLFPEDDDGREVVERALAELTGALTESSRSPHGGLTEASLRAQSRPMVELYVGPDGHHYGQITAWARHQRINRPTPSSIPGPNDPGSHSDKLIRKDSLSPHGGLTEDSVRTHGALSEDSLRERKGRDINQVSSSLGLGRGSGGRGPSELAPVDNSGSPAPSADAAVAHPTEADGAETPDALVPVAEPSPTKADRRGRRLPDGWAPARTAATLDLETGHDPAWLERELDRFRDHWAAQAGAKGRKSDWDATWRNWLRRADDYAPSRPRDGAREGPDWDRLMARAVAADAADARALDGGAA